MVVAVGKRSLAMRICVLRREPHKESQGCVCACSPAHSGPGGCATFIYTRPIAMNGTEARLVNARSSASARTPVFLNPPTQIFLWPEAHSDHHASVRLDQ
eukprot:scaffold19583_cov28-Tisochrysis_lutea.AAC.2